MEWTKSTISKAELEKKQSEYMEAAMSMAKKAGNTEQTVKTEPETITKAEIVEEIVEEIDDLTEVIEEIKENTEEVKEEITEETTEEITDIVHADDKNDNFGVFNADELAAAIESGEVSGEGLRQAAEILEEMTRKTETMRKLIEEQENSEEIFDSGEDYGLNGFINRHNSNCRGCGNESDAQSP